MTKQYSFDNNYVFTVKLSVPSGHVEAYNRCNSE